MSYSKKYLTIFLCTTLLSTLGMFLYGPKQEVVLKDIQYKNVYIEQHKYSELDVFRYDIDEMLCLAKNIYHEARGESEEGMKAVSYVTLNRVMTTGFPDSICGVVYQRNSRGCQFSWTCDGLKDIMNDPKAVAKSFSIAYQTINEYDDFTGGSLFYHASHIKPYWSDTFTRVASIGDHIFYKH